MGILRRSSLQRFCHVQGFHHPFFMFSFIFSVGPRLMIVLHCKRNLTRISWKIFLSMKNLKESIVQNGCSNTCMRIAMLTVLKAGRWVLRVSVKTMLSRASNSDIYLSSSLDIMSGTARLIRGQSVQTWYEMHDGLHLLSSL